MFRLSKYHVQLVVFDKGSMEATGLFAMFYDHVNFTSLSGG
jgi:hypothetical protein